MKQKIKKSGVKHKFLGNLSKAEKLAVAVPVVVSVGCLSYIFYSGGFDRGTTEEQLSKASREILLTSDGDWEQMPYSGLEIWMPSEIPLEELPEDVSDTQRVGAIRDKGNMPELAMGVIVCENEEDVEFKIKEDPATLVDYITPVLNEAVGEMINGAYPTMSVDVTVNTWHEAIPVLEGFGEAEVICVYQNPKDETDKYTEAFTTNLYFNVGLFDGDPVIAWGTWDYSTYKGEEKTREYVKDAIVSMSKIDKIEKEESEQTDISGGESSIESGENVEIVEDGANTTINDVSTQVATQPEV